MPTGDHVRRRRARLKFSPEQVAQAAEMAADRLAAIESGEVPSTVELARLAAALDTEPGALYRGEVESPPSRSRARFLAPAGVRHVSDHDSHLLARASEAGRIGHHLQALLGLNDSPVRVARKVRAVQRRPMPWKQGYDLGQKARFIFDNSGKAVVSMQGLLEENYVHVAMVPFESPDIIAASLYEADALSVILLNMGAERAARPLPRRAVLAHELCHLLTDGGERDLVTIVSRADDDDVVEARANAFAPSFLAPSEWVTTSETEPLDQVMEIAKRWGLSFEAAAWHAKNLEFITPTEADNLVAQARNVRVEAHFEPPLPRRTPEQQGLLAEIAPLTHGLISELALMALDASLVSKARAEEILAFR